MRKKIEGCMEQQLQEYEFTQSLQKTVWIPAFAGMTDDSESIQPETAPNSKKTVH